MPKDQDYCTQNFTAYWQNNIIGQRSFENEFCTVDEFQQRATKHQKVSITKERGPLGVAIPYAMTT